MVAGEVDQQLRALTALLEDLCQIPSTNKVVNNNLKLQSLCMSCPLLESVIIKYIQGTHTYMQAKHSCTYNKNKININKIVLWVLATKLNLCPMSGNNMVKNQNQLLQVIIYILLCSSTLFLPPPQLPSCNSLQSALPLHQVVHQTQPNKYKYQVFFLSLRCQHCTVVVLQHGLSLTSNRKEVRRCIYHDSYNSNCLQIHPW